MKIENGLPVINRGSSIWRWTTLHRQPTLVGRVQDKIDDETITSSKKAVKTRMEHHRREA